MISRHVALLLVVATSFLQAPVIDNTPDRPSHPSAEQNGLEVSAEYLAYLARQPRESEKKTAVPASKSIEDLAKLKSKKDESK